MLRSYDPELGRFMQQDPYDEFANSYAGMGNDPANLVDPTGGCATCETLANVVITAKARTATTTKVINTTSTLNKVFNVTTTSVRLVHVFNSTSSSSQFIKHGERGEKSQTAAGEDYEYSHSYNETFEESSSITFAPPEVEFSYSSEIVTPDGDIGTLPNKRLEASLAKLERKLYEGTLEYKLSRIGSAPTVGPYQPPKTDIQRFVSESPFVQEAAVGVLTGGLGNVAKGVARGVTTSDGFLLRGFTLKTPFNIPVQRFGNMTIGRPDYWGARIGTSKFANRTFGAIKPSWNPLTQYTTGVIPKGTTIKFGIIGPQGWRYPGCSLQFIVSSRNVINQSSKLIR